MNPEIFVKLLVDELKAIAAGTSKFTNGAILFDPKKLPFAAVLDRFAANPTKDLMKEVIKIAEQDFGMRFGNFVGANAEKLNVEFFKEQPAPPAPPAPEIPFKQALYNELTTVLSRGRERAIDQKLLDTLTQDVNRLANVIDAEIQKQAREQSQKVCELAIKMLGQEIDNIGLELDRIYATLDIPSHKQVRTAIAEGHPTGPIPRPGE